MTSVGTSGFRGRFGAAVDAVSDGQAALAGHAMMNAYRRFLAEARAIIPKAQHSEFEAMFPTDVVFEPSNPRNDLLDAAAQSSCPTSVVHASVVVGRLRPGSEAED
jgi:hypothetical protein